MDASSLADFNAARLDSQYAMFGRAAAFRGKPLTVCATGTDTRRQFDTPGSKRLLRSVTVRIRATDLATKPQVDERIAIEGEELAIISVRPLPVGGEYVVTCSEIGG